MGGKRSNQFVSSQDINNQPQFQKYIPPQKRVQGRYPENFNSNNRPRLEVPDFHRKQNFPFQSVVCNYCKRKGHTISECYAFKNKQPNGSKPTGFISSSGEKSKISSFIEEQPKQTFTNNNTNLKDQSHADPVMKIFQPFVYDARVSLSITPLQAIPIKILRDTGALQSLILTNTLPFSTQSYTVKTDRLK